MSGVNRTSTDLSLSAMYSFLSGEQMKCPLGRMAKAKAICWKIRSLYPVSI